jgi:hypothetical protein
MRGGLRGGFCVPANFEESYEGICRVHKVLANSVFHALRR